MTPEHEQVQTPIDEQACKWFVAEDAEPLDSQQSAALVSWLAGSPRHVEEFLGVAVIARDLRVAAADPEHTVEYLVARAQAEDDREVRPLLPRVFAAVTELSMRRWRTATVMIAALGLASLGLLLLWNLRPSPHASAPAVSFLLHFQTRHGEQQTHRLADGSMLHVNTDTSVTVRYSRTERLVLLASGQAGFEVAHDPGRPFRVLAGAAETVAIGTRFDVRLAGDSTVVTVADGRVTVGLAEAPQQRGPGADYRGPPAPVELGPNQQISVSRDEWPATPTTVDAQRATAWLHRQISFDHEPLERVAAEFNRYASKPIEITTPELRKAEITGTFSIDDSEEFLAFLRSVKGVRVDVTDTRIRVSSQ